jgi:hypothetical protein
MNRRQFLQRAVPGTVAAALLPMIWVPKRTFFLPPLGGWRLPVDVSDDYYQLSWPARVRDIGLRMVVTPVRRFERSSIAVADRQLWNVYSDLVGSGNALDA